MNRWLFIFKSKGSDPAIHYAELRHSGKRLLIYGVETNDQAVDIIRRTASAQDEGICLYAELCGAFDNGDVAYISERANVDVPIGCVIYMPEELKKMKG